MRRCLFFSGTWPTVSVTASLGSSGSGSSSSKTYYLLPSFEFDEEGGCQTAEQRRGGLRMGEERKGKVAHGVSQDNNRRRATTTTTHSSLRFWRILVREKRLCS